MWMTNWLFENSRKRQPFEVEQVGSRQYDKHPEVGDGPILALGFTNPTDLRMIYTRDGTVEEIEDHATMTLLCSTQDTNDLIRTILYWQDRQRLPDLPASMIPGKQDHEMRTARIRRCMEFIDQTIGHDQAADD